MAYSVRKVCVSKTKYPELFAYLDECAHKEKLLANAALFILRNHYTAYSKDPDKLTSNEKLVEEEIAEAVSHGMPSPGASLIYEQNTSQTHNFSGKRIRRGLYQTADGRFVNADLNGAANILRKAFPDAFDGKDIYSILREVETIRFSDLYKCKRLIPATAAL